MEEDLESRHEFDPETEPFQPHPSYDDEELHDGMKIPGELWNELFGYQKTCKSETVERKRARKK